MHLECWLENLKIRDGLGDQGVDGSIVVLCTFKKYTYEYGAGSILIL